MLDFVWQACGAVPLCDQLFPSPGSYFSALPFQFFWYGLVLGTLIGFMGTTLVKSFVLPMFFVQIVFAVAAGCVLWHI